MRAGVEITKIVCSDVVRISFRLRCFFSIVSVDESLSFLSKLEFEMH